MPIEGSSPPPFGKLGRHVRECATKAGVEIFDASRRPSCAQVSDCPTPPLESSILGSQFSPFPFCPSEHLVLRLKDAAAVGRVAVDGQVELQAVWQKLDAALTSPVAVAEGPEHGGGVGRHAHGVRG